MLGCVGQDKRRQNYIEVKKWNDKVIAEIMDGINPDELKLARVNLVSGNIEYYQSQRR